MVLEKLKEQQHGPGDSSAVDVVVDGVESAEIDLQHLVDGFDELNFAEFPMTSLSKRVEAGKKTIVTSKEVTDKKTGEKIRQKLTITAADAYGLPTPAEQDVFLCLVKLANDQRFASRKVTFSRYQLVRYLRWTVGGESYARLELALKRLLGTSYYFENAWTDRASGTWMNVGLHIIEDLVVDNPQRKDKSGAAERSSSAMSSFTWSEILYNNMKAGGLKSLNLLFYFDLENAIAKRLFRFLDKRFYNTTTLIFDLRELAFEHVGMSRKSPIGEVKRSIDKAYNELVAKNYLKPLENRYRKVRKGEYFVRFCRAAKAISPPGEKPITDGQAAELIARGVTPAKAKQIAEKFSKDAIDTKIRVWDWMRSRNDKRIAGNPPGFLVSSIEQNYDAPQEYHQELEKERILKLKQEQKARREEEQALAKQKAMESDLRSQKAIEEFWQRLSPEEQRRADKIVVERVEERIAELGLKPESRTHVQRGIMREYALEQLAFRNGAETGSKASQTDLGL